MKCRGCNRIIEKDWYGYVDLTGQHLICGACWTKHKKIL